MGGDLVAYDWILPVLILPGVVIWGERVFVCFPREVDDSGRPLHDLKTVPIYKETLPFGIPTPGFFREQAQAMTTAGTLPDDLR